jgi:hypothetical protein
VQNFRYIDCISMSMFTIHYLFRMLTRVNIAFNIVYTIAISHFKFSLFQADANTVIAFTFRFLNRAFLCLQFELYSVKNVIFAPCLSCFSSHSFPSYLLGLQLVIMLNCLLSSLFGCSLFCSRHLFRFPIYCNNL